MYTVKTTSKKATLMPIKGGKKVIIPNTDKRYQKAVDAQKAKRLVNITPTGRFTTSKDYHGA